jgi:hypothetical protein
MGWGIMDMPPKAKRVPAGKRYPLNMRTTKELREKIEAAARTSGRSLVQEVEFRLELSFNQDSVIRETVKLILGQTQGVSVVSDPGKTVRGKS